MTCPLNRSTEFLICVTSLLRLESGTLDYQIIFSPSVFIYSSCNCFSSSNPITKFLNMNILSWNVKGAEAGDFRRTFRDLISSHHPDVVILTETRISGKRADNIISSLGFERYTKVNAMGFAGGIWVLWNPNTVFLEPISSSFPELHLLCKV